MTFRDCACYVWAIDGYTNDARSRSVMASFLAAADAIVSHRSRFRSLNAKVRKLVEDCRIDAETGRSCIVYGGFQRNTEPTPVHMWVEYDGHIYDTVPDSGLMCVLATRDTRRCPGAYGDGPGYHRTLVGRYQTYLTRSQYQNIRNELESDSSDEGSDSSDGEIE